MKRGVEGCGCEVGRCCMCARFQFVMIVGHWFWLAGGVPWCAVVWSVAVAYVRVRVHSVLLGVQGLESMQLLLVRRAKMLEFALKQERLSRTGTTYVGPLVLLPVCVVFLWMLPPPRTIVCLSPCDAHVHVVLLVVR